MFAYGYTLAAGYVVRQKLKIIVFIISGVVMEFCCQDLVIRKGKVRNQRAAVWTALVLSIVFMTVSCTAAFYFYGSYGGLWVRGIQLFSLFLFLTAGFTAVAGKSFCEKSKKWMREFSLYFALPDNITTLLQKLIASEDSVIDELNAIPFSYDGQSGRLFTYAENGEHQAPLVNRREKRGFSMEKLRAVIQGVMSMALLALMHTQIEEQFGGGVPILVFYFYGGSCVVFVWLTEK